MKPHVGAEAECHSFLPSALDVSGYLHALVALSLTKQPLVPINKDGEWTTGQVGTLGGGAKSLTHGGNHIDWTSVPYKCTGYDLCW
jgi:hypothetical protein